MQARAKGLALGTVLLLSAGMLLHVAKWNGREPASGRSAGRPAPPADIIAGTVTSRGDPVAGAIVRVKGRPELATTDPAGRFRLARPEGGPLLVTAARPGYYIRGVEPAAGPVALELEPLPAGDWEGYAWIDPTPEEGSENHCGNCHAAIYGEWRSTGHARAATGRRFMNLYEGSDWEGNADRGWSLLADYPLGAGVCVPCHAPTIPLDHPAMDDMRKVEGVAALGVHCDFCHKIAGAPAEFEGLNHGRFAFDLLRPKEGQVFFGPLDDVARGRDSFSPLQKDSRICAACHEGVVFGRHTYSTYSEWLASDARRQGKHCQSCHMKPTGRMTNIAPGAGGIPRDPATLASHVSTPGGRPEMLRNCLNVQCELHRRPDRLEAEVTVAARGAGHRVPGGYVDRHLVLAVEAADAAGSGLAALDGPRLPSAAGDLSGVPGRLFARLMSDPQGRSPAPFWQASTDAEDTRLAPDRPVRVRFTFPPQAARVRVRLIYRLFWEQVARDKKWPDNDIVVVDRTWGE